MALSKFSHRETTDIYEGKSAQIFQLLCLDFSITIFYQLKHLQNLSPLFNKTYGSLKR